MTEFTFKYPEQAMLARLRGLLPRCANCIKLHSEECPHRGQNRTTKLSNPDPRFSDYPTCEEFTFHAPESQEP